MKNIVIILLAVATLGQILSKPVILMNFLINRDYIAANLCENRNQPDLGCQGKCHLKKQMDQDEQSSEKKVAAQEIVIIFDHVYFTIGPVFTTVLPLQFEPYQPSVLERSSPETFHPPDAWV